MSVTRRGAPPSEGPSEPGHAMTIALWAKEEHDRQADTRPKRTRGLRPRPRLRGHELELRLVNDPKAPESPGGRGA